MSPSQPPSSPSGRPKKSSGQSLPKSPSPAFERRLSTPSKFSLLPHDFLALTREVFLTNFETALQEFAQISEREQELSLDGAIFADEVLLRVSIASPGQLSANTFLASCDFDPRASSPQAEELLRVCVDALGSVLGQVLLVDSDLKGTARMDHFKALAEESLSALENVPFEWSDLTINSRKVWVKMDKSNPLLEGLAEAWLNDHDPERAEQLSQEEEEAEGLFVTGPKSRQ